jgi:hypothetical protein
MWTYTCAEREILYNTYQEMAIWKSIVTLIYSELLALGKKIDKLPPHKELFPLL